MEKPAFVFPRDFEDLSAPLSYILLACIFFVSASIYLRPKKIKYADAPIACVKDGNLAAARERFRGDARRMLCEGYEQVSLAKNQQCIP